MTKFAAPKIIPPIINWERWCRNGQIPQAELMRQICGAQHHLLAYRHKVVFQYTVDPRSISGGASGSVERWHFYHRTGFGVTKMRAHFIMAPAPSSSGTDPYIVLSITPSGGSLSLTDELHFGKTDGTDTEKPQNFGWSGTIEWAVDENTEYGGIVLAVDYARPISVVIYEVSNTELDDTAVTHVADISKFETGRPILDSSHQELLQAQGAMIGSSLSHLMWWSKDISAKNRSADSTYENVIDGSTGAVTKTSSAYTPGWKIDLSNHATRGQTTVPVRFAWRGAAVGSGTAAVRLKTDSTTLVNPSTTSTTMAWHTSDFTLSAGVHEFDLQFGASGGEFDGINFEAASLFILET